MPSRTPKITKNTKKHPLKEKNSLLRSNREKFKKWGRWKDSKSVDQTRSIRTVKRTDWSCFSFHFLGTMPNIEPIWAKSETNFCIWESNADTHLALFLFYYQKNISFFKTNLLKLYRFNDHPIKNQGRKQKNEKNFSRRIQSNYRLKTRQRKEWSANFNTRFADHSLRCRVLRR